MSHPLHAASLFSTTSTVALITGGGSGIGLMIAKTLDANGAAAVYIMGRRRETLEAAAKEAINGSIIPVVGDVTSKESLQAVAARVQKEHGYLNVLFANSGIIGTETSQVLSSVAKDRKPTVAEFAQSMFAEDMADFTNVMHVNVTATFYTSLAFLELLDAGNRKENVSSKSQVIIITSIAGYSRLPQSSFAYSVSKAAANHLVKMLSSYFIDYEIRVNAIAPGLYPSELTSARIPAHEYLKPWEEGAMPRERAPLRRTGGESDMAGAALFLTSAAGAFVNGNILVTDGGRLGQLPNGY